jgi:sulfite reductase (ferredoxin)
LQSSTGIAVELERVLNENIQYSNNREITIKISGCMNACGQHNMAEIGFQGMSINAGKLVAPAYKFIRRRFRNGNGRFSDKDKIQTEEEDQLRLILNDFEANANGQSFLIIMTLKAKIFLRFLKPLADLTNLTKLIL